MAVYRVTPSCIAAEPPGGDPVSSSGFLWLDFQREEAATWASEVERYGLVIDREHVSDSENDQHPPYHDGTSIYDMVIMREIIVGSDPFAFTTTALTCFVNDSLLVTIGRGAGTAVKRTIERMRRGGARIPGRPVSLLHRILNTAVDDYLSLRKPMIDQIETWQDLLLDPDNPFDDWMDLMQQRRRLRRVELLCQQQEEALTAWMDDPVVAIDDPVTIRFNDLREHLRRVANQLEQTEADIEAVVQVHFAAMSHRANEIMKVLTVVAAIFLPLSLVAGIFGMNFDVIPGLHTDFGFGVTLGAMIALGSGMLWLFRKRRWV
jgi:magnesium transporter